LLIFENKLKKSTSKKENKPNLEKINIFFEFWRNINTIPRQILKILGAGTENKKNCHQPGLGAPKVEKHWSRTIAVSGCV
jgi:hypothetical protein